MDSTSEQKTQEQQQQKTTQKRKHVTLTISNKLKVIEKIERGVSGRLIAEMFGISRQTVSDIKKHTPIIKAYAAEFDGANNTKNTSISKRMKFRRTKDDRLESALYAWYIRQRRNDVDVQISDLKTAAEELKQQLGITTVVCNATWLARFRYRNNIQDSDIGIIREEDPQSEGSFSLNDKEEDPKRRDEKEDSEINEASAMVPFDFIIKEEEETEDVEEWDYIPSESNEQEQEESTTTTTTTTTTMNMAIPKENSVLKAAREGIDAVINYIGHTSNRELWTHYERLRVVRELIIEDQKKMHGNSLEGVEAQFNFPNT
ncbi:uncharacterized protein LOC129921189 [Episyrphus balteatus]|uniref:uncharacterized protein LOC129921189 n=1 Tax=Episyrphus balteatus TaxID=286459 RepID=UPI0024851807|nr:uncharacterized protein LOC129921189 [Episyrphus balteatus]